MAEARVVRGACPHDCPDTCAWEVTVEDGRATKLAGAAEHPFTHGGLGATRLERAICAHTGSAGTFASDGLSPTWWGSTGRRPGWG